ncbi:hypothetical protein GQ600_6411 [Phytophthora cactorum]|nr:hypothetical protein GQ600_6411 [Phytophthora cactorum]
MIIDSNPISESTRSRSSKTPLRAQVASTNSAMRLTFFLTLLVATFVAIAIDFTINSADNTALANNIASEPDTRHPEKGSHKASREGGEGRTGIAAGIAAHVAARHGRLKRLQSADAMADVVTHDPITRKELVAALVGAGLGIAGIMYALISHGNKFVLAGVAVALMVLHVSGAIRNAVWTQQLLQCRPKSCLCGFIFHDSYTLHTNFLMESSIS